MILGYGRTLDKNAASQMMLYVIAMVPCRASVPCKLHGHVPGPLIGHDRQDCDEIAWVQLEAEYAIPHDRKFWCPYLECSALMGVVNPEPSIETPCVACGRALCFFCRTAAHPGLTCGEVKVSLAPPEICCGTVCSVCHGQHACIQLDHAELHER